MKCMKCGREIEESQVFCEECRAVMEKYPVKPGIAIQLPRREDAGASKKNTQKRKTAPTAEEKIQRLRGRLRAMTIVWLITLFLLGVTIYPTVVFIRSIDIPLPGQNYRAIESTETTEYR